MKRAITITLIMISPIIMMGQNAFAALYDDDENRFKTASSNLINMNCFDDTKILKIGVRYYDYSSGDYTRMSITIPYANIEHFKTQIKQIDNKFKEWEEVAKNNNVQMFTKEIPVNLLTYIKEVSCSKLTYPEKRNIKAVFRVDYGKPTCDIEVSLSGYGNIQYHRLELTGYEISHLCDEIDKTILIHKEKVTEKKKTDDLFR